MCSSCIEAKLNKAATTDESTGVMKSRLDAPKSRGSEWCAGRVSYGKGCQYGMRKISGVPTNRRLAG